MHQENADNNISANGKHGTYVLRLAHL